MDYRALTSLTSTSFAGYEVETARYLIDELIDTLGQGNPNNVRFLLIPSRTLTTGDVCQDLGPRGLDATIIGATHDVDPVPGAGIMKARFNGVDEYWEVADNALLSAISGGVDAAISVGCAFNMSAVSAANKYLLCKWDDQTPNWEWRLMLAADERLHFSIIDDSVVNSRRARYYSTILGANIWYIIIATYDGRGGANAEDGISLNLWDPVNGYQAAVDDADDNGVGVYVDMEDTVQPVMIGAADTAVGPTPADFFPGEIVLPFMVLGELSAANAEKASVLMRRLVGLMY